MHTLPRFLRAEAIASSYDRGAPRIDASAAPPMTGSAGTRSAAAPPITVPRRAGFAAGFGALAVILAALPVAFVAATAAPAVRAPPALQPAATSAAAAPALLGSSCNCRA